MDFENLPYWNSLDEETQRRIQLFSEGFYEVPSNKVPFSDDPAPINDAVSLYAANAWVMEAVSRAGICVSGVQWDIMLPLYKARLRTILAI